MPEGREKRKEKRIKARLPVRISYRGSQVPGVTDNISRLGAYVETARNIPLGAEFTVTLELPSPETSGSGRTEINCRASVFRSGLIRQEAQMKYYGLGVFFTDFLDKTGRQDLSDFVEYLSLQEEQLTRETLEHFRSRRASPDKTQSASPVDIAKCLAALEQILAKLEEMSRLAKSKQKAS